MIQKPLYTGNGVSLSPVNAEGRTLSTYIRLVAEDGMAITNGITITICVDVPERDVAKWKDCDVVPEDEIPDSEALNIILGGGGL